MDKKLIIFVVVGFLVLGLAIAGSTFFVLSQIGKSSSETSTKQVTELKSADLAKLELADSITTNIYEGDQEQHIARVTISLGVDQSSKKDYEAFTTLYNENIAVVRNEIIQVMREQTFSMMNKADAQTKLGSEIVNRLNKLLDTELIKEVYFKDFFVQ